MFFLSDDRQVQTIRDVWKGTDCLQKKRGLYNNMHFMSKHNGLVFFAIPRWWCNLELDIRVDKPVYVPVFSKAHGLEGIKLGLTQVRFK